MIAAEAKIIEENTADLRRKFARQAMTIGLYQQRYNAMPISDQILDDAMERAHVLPKEDS